MKEDPERAQQMLSQAQNSSVTALQELRGLVRVFARRCWRTAD